MPFAGPCYATEAELTSYWKLNADEIKKIKDKQPEYAANGWVREGQYALLQRDVSRTFHFRPGDF